MTDGLEERFAYHPPRDEARIRSHEKVRYHCYKLAATLDELLPDGREKALVITNLEQAMFWGNAALARQPDEAPPQT